jgi:GNAT superfamily N-acetyltransferase
VIRRAWPEDAEAVVQVYRESRAEAMPWLPVVHTEEEDVAWYRARLGGEAWVYELDGRIAGFALVQAEILHALYVSPGAQGHGVGSGLFRQAQAARPGGLRLWAFRDNTRARRFYEARGCRVIAATDGDNEEQMPDVLYEWRPEASE